MTGGAGSAMTRGYEDAVSARIEGELQDVESDLPEDVKNEAVRVFRSAVVNQLPIGQAVEKVQKELKVMVDEKYKGQRLKGFVKMDYDINVVEIKVNKFAGGNCQLGAGIGTKRMVCPDPFMGKLADPNLKR